MQNRAAWMPLILLLMASGDHVYGEVYLTKEEALKLAFTDADRVTKRTAVLLPRQQEEVRIVSGARHTARIFTYYSGIKDEATVGHAVIGSARGKGRRFKFLLAVDPGLAVKMVEILTYHDTHGSGIRQGWFKRQFIGKSISDPLRVHEDLRYVSGATLSCEALIEGVRVALATLEVLLSETPVAKGGSDAGLGKGAKPGSISLVSDTDVPYGKRSAFRRAGLKMGTILDVNLYARDARAANQAFRMVFAEMDRLENLLGTVYRVSSNGWNEEPGSWKSIVEGSEFVQLFQSCLRMKGVTLGAFDVTCAPLTRLWKEASRTGVLPSQEEVNRARRRAGADLLKTDSPEATLAAAREGRAIDFGGIGKGYALDRAVTMLEEEGIEAAVLDFGGIIRTFGPGPEKGGWPVHIRNPSKPASHLATLTIAEAAVSTSGDSERSLRIGGKSFSHILDPRTGWPVSGMVSVTVVARSAAEADALSTGIYVLGREEGQRVSENHSIAALIVSDKGEFRSEAFRVLESVQ